MEDKMISLHFQLNQKQPETIYTQLTCLSSLIVALFMKSNVFKMWDRRGCVITCRISLLSTPQFQEFMKSNATKCRGYLVKPHLHL